MPAPTNLEHCGIQHYHNRHTLCNSSGFSINLSHLANTLTRRGLQAPLAVISCSGMKRHTCTLIALLRMRLCRKTHTSRTSLVCTPLSCNTALCQTWDSRSNLQATRSVCPNLVMRHSTDQKCTGITDKGNLLSCKSAWPAGPCPETYL